MNQDEELNLVVQGLREALRDRVSTITDDYEFRIVGLRVELTKKERQLMDVIQENEELKQRVAILETANADETSPEDSDDSD